MSTQQDATAPPPPSPAQALASTPALASASPPADRRPALGVGQWLGLSIGVLLVLAIAAIGVALAVNHRLSDRRHLVLDQVEPALLDALRLENGLVNQETGIRGYLLTGRSEFLQPFYQGHADEQRAYKELRAQARVAPSHLLAELEAVRASAHAWREEYVEPALHRQRSEGRSLAASTLGKQRFDAIRTAMARLQGDLQRKLASDHSGLEHDANLLEAVLIAAGALIVASVLAAGFVLRAIITRPLSRLGTEAGRVAAGEFETPLSSRAGAREIVELAEGIDVMRTRILEELDRVQAARATLERQARELERSNRDLEQFAYVASHDLQEPLRKVASFCQALQQRYGGQLDERADQYIEFAVDGARRMQVLINDLLEFSRVGRGERALTRVAMDEVLAEVERSLSGALREAGARVVSEPLPAVQGERSLLASLLQNLIANAIKFRGQRPPVVSIAVTRVDGMWELSCTDNGIGVEPQYAERIFVIFQRLHAKERYEGTGIGLALCRKIVEHHGGRIWLDTEHHGGARICFTLPVAQGEDE